MSAGFDCREGGAKEYAAYLETTLGKLRLDLAWEHLVYLAAWVLDALPYPELFAFERKLGAMPAFAAVARYTQLLVRVNRAKPFPSASGAPA